jgi:signal transduction histidine kinase
VNVRRLDRTELLRNIAHAFRVPVNSIFNETDLMRLGLGGKLDAQAQEALLSINQDAHHLHHILEALFELIQADTVILNETAVDLMSLVSSAVDQLKEPASHRGQTLTIRAVGAVPPVYADAEIVNQVLLKLLGHVIQFTAQETITVGLDVAPDRVVVSIGDNAADTAHSMSRLPDNQLEAELSIGLLFCLHSIERQGGSLWADQSVSGNFILKFSLPLTASQNTPKK